MNILWIYLNIKTKTLFYMERRQWKINIDMNMNIKYQWNFYSSCIKNLSSKNKYFELKNHFMHNSEFILKLMKYFHKW